MTEIPWCFFESRNSSFNNVIQNNITEIDKLLNFDYIHVLSLLFYTYFFLYFLGKNLIGWCLGQSDTTWSGQSSDLLTRELSLGLVLLRLHDIYLTWPCYDFVWINRKDLFAICHTCFVYASHVLHYVSLDLNWFNEVKWIFVLYMSVSPGLNWVNLFSSVWKTTNL